MATAVPAQGAKADPAPAAEYDQEIVDMASYIHKYKPSSKLAVCDILSHQSIDN